MTKPAMLCCVRDRGTMRLPRQRRCAPMPGVTHAEWSAEVWVPGLDNRGFALLVEDLPFAFDFDKPMQAVNPAKGPTCEEVAQEAARRLFAMRPDIIKVRTTFTPLNTPSERGVEAVLGNPLALLADMASNGQ